MRIGPVVARLRDRCPTLRQVLAATSGAIPSSYPAAYVWLASRTAAPNELVTGVTSQRLELRLAVEITVRHAAEAAAGGPAADLLADVLEEVEAALAGFQAPGDEQHKPLELVEGRPVALDAGQLTWRETWRTWRLLRSA